MRCFVLLRFEVTSNSTIRPTRSLSSRSLIGDSSALIHSALVYGDTGAGDAMADDDDDEDANAKGEGPGEVEDEALSVSGGLSLMHLELSEEDQPAVVPYEEVRFGGVAQEEGQGRNACVADVFPTCRNLGIR